MKLMSFFFPQKTTCCSKYCTYCHGTEKNIAEFLALPLLLTAPQLQYTVQNERVMFFFFFFFFFLTGMEWNERKSTGYFFPFSAL